MEFGLGVALGALGCYLLVRGSMAKEVAVAGDGKEGEKKKEAAVVQTGERVKAAKGRYKMVLVVRDRKSVV